MIYPEPLKKGSRIAITAFSSGIEERHEQRFDEIHRTLTERGYEVVIGDCLKGNHKHVSASKEKRAKELMDFLSDDSIDAIAPPWGGELAIEVIPLLDFKKIENSKPKWIFGFSDVSTITSVISSKVGWITVHSSNLMDVIDTNTDPLVANTLSYLEQEVGSTLAQKASEKHTRIWPKIEIDPLSFVVGDKPTEWKWLSKPNGVEVIRGRLIGGCWDTLIHLFETPFLNLSDFKSNFQEDGVVLYLENVEMSPCDLVRAIHSMEFKGVFKVIDGLVLGRNFAIDPDEASNLTYLEVLKEHLSNKNIPIIYDVDIGHVPPNLTLLNGSLAEFSIEDGQGKITQWLK
ncbi:MAG: LD-carboxypeptidase [Reinekea sp.]